MRNNPQITAAIQAAEYEGDIVALARDLEDAGVAALEARDRYDAHRIARSNRYGLPASTVPRATDPRGVRLYLALYALEERVADCENALIAAIARRAFNRHKAERKG